jgi:membrane protein
MFLLTLLQFYPMTESAILSSFKSVVPTKITSFLIVIVSEIYDRSSSTVISVTALTALWSASKGFLAIIKGLNSVYDIDETRNYIKLRFIATFYTLIFACILMITLAILVFGNKIYIWVTTKVPVLNELAIIVISLRTIGGLLVLSLFFLLLYNVMPDRTSRIMSELPGAVLAASGWMLFSYLYSYYIDNMGNFSYIYGSLTAVVLLMLWLYFCMYILFIGAEINVFLLSNHKYVTWMKDKESK